jgi:predicted transcriptional regulator
MAQANKIVTVKLDPETKNKLQHLSKVKSRSTHWLMKKAIDDYVEKEDIKEKLRQETLSRWKEAEAGKVTPHDKVIDWLDSWGNDNEKSMQ